MRENSCDSGSDSDGDDQSGSEAGSASDAGSNSDSDNSKPASEHNGNNSDNSRAASNSGSGSSESGSESGSGSSSGSDNESGSESGKEGYDAEGQGSNDDERNGSLNTSRASSHSKSSSSSGKSNKDILKKCWEKDPDIYGIRRSGRERKQPERISVENAEKSNRKLKRRQSSNQWNSSDESISEEPSDSDSATGRRPLVKKPTKKKTVYRRNSNDGNNRKPTRTVRTTVGNKVSYKETSEDENEDEDLVEVDWSQTEKEEENVQNIEKIITHRIGKKGAVGMQTYIYEIDKNGDPNSDFDPKDPTQTEMQFQIKWKGWAHIHNTYESEESLKTQKVKGYKKLENYLRKEEEISLWKNRATPEEVEYMEIQAELERDLFASHLLAERIFAEAFENGNTYFYVKWQNLPYSEATWELEEIITTRYPTQLKAFRDREESQHFPKQCPVLKHRPKFSPCKMQPDFIGGDSEDFTLRDYQLDGLNWLVHSWCKHNSVILADEMGLGKTIQTIAFLSYLFHVHHLYGPFLLVLPLSTLNAWQREFAQWAPDMNVIVYIGDRDSRRIIHEYEYTFPSKKIKFNAVLTTYEILLRDKEVLQDSCQWAALVIDEAHRLKNEESQLYQALSDFKTNHRLLITGTPLQNSLKELWALLHFIMPDKFNDWDYFDSQHNGEDMKKGFHRLHKQLEPYLLRRVKKDVEKSLPAKVEQILRVDMAQLQKQYYKWILTKNYEMLKKGTKGSTTSFVNIVMELKKCCNHAFLTKPNEDPYNNQSDMVLQLLRGSGKLMLLDKLLVRLNETGHRVLIFSQMVRMLDILAHYLQLRRFPFQRLDGSINGELRRQALDHFNAEGSNDFCFLLSTRAGGLGINLATADTVIIFDSDWNPQNDLQAQARAHRIGQKNQVNIYRLVTKNSIEETIIERAKQKMVLDHLVIQSMDTSGRTVFNKKMSNSSATPFNKEELNAILKFGAEELFKDDDENEEDPVCDIDEILRRAETRDEGPASAGDELLSAFKVASFALEEEEEVSKLGSAVDENTNDWDEIIPEKFRSKVLDEEKQKEIADLYLPPRKRKAVNQDDKEEEESPPKKLKKGSESSDEEGEASDDERPKRRGRPRMYQKETVKGFTDPEVRRFFKSFKKFSNPMRRLDVIAVDADMREKPMQDLCLLGQTILERCREALVEHEAALQNVKVEPTDGAVKKQKKDRGPSFRLSGVAINAKSTLALVDELSPLDKVIPHAPVERASWVLPLKKVKDAHWDVPWGIQDDSRLLRGIYEYGMGSWEIIKGDPALNLGEKILLEGDMKPQAKHLENRALYFLKILRNTVNVVGAKTGRPRGPKAKLRKGKEIKGISKEIIENDDTSDEEAIKDSASVASTKKIPKEEKKVAVKEIKEEKIEEIEKVKIKEETPHKEKEKKKKKRDKKERSSQGPLHITANGEPTPLDSTQELDQNHPLWAECKEKMRPMKKALKALDYPNNSLSQEEQIQHTRKCLIQIGDHIEKTLQQHQDHDTFKEWKNLLWQFVSKFTEYDAKKLHKLYKKHKKLLEEKKDGSGKDGKATKKEKTKKEKKDDEKHHSSKRKHEDDSNTPNKILYNGLAPNSSNDRSRDSVNQRPDNWRDRDGNPHREPRDRSGDRNYQARNHGGGMNRDWHSSGNRESRYPQDFKRDGYHREPFKPHGYHRGHSDWGARPPHHPLHPPHQRYGGPNYPPARYPPVMGYGGSMMGGRMPTPYPPPSHRSPEWGSKGRPMDRSDWSSPKEGGVPERSNKSDWPSKDPRQEAQRHDRPPKPYVPPPGHVN